ncbi:MAG: proteasome accessory factor PafA2 family protein, partial [Acidobacteriota bacterium]
RSVELADGRSLTAVEMQMSFAEAAQRYIEETPQPKAFAAVLQLWTEMLQKLKQDPLQTADSLDWAIKLHFLEKWRSRKGLDWAASQLKELDIRYHETDPEKGIYHLLEGSGRLRRLLDESVVNRALEEPVSDTRARARSQAFRRRGNLAVSANWSTISSAGGSEEEVVREQFNSPLACSTVLSARKA